MSAQDRARLEALIDAADQMVAFTGAGISTECGVPDFRSADSAWKRHAPIPFPDFLASEEMRVEAWRRKFAMDDLYAGAQPGRGHAALARLVAAQKMTHVITQNIDGLHQASGIAPECIIELHGNGTYARCLDCGQRHELFAMRAVVEGERRAPSCAACGGIVKSATISFGQSMPQVEMQRARRATLACDLFLVIGSSLVVHPAAAFPVMAKENGAVLVILNKDPTPLDGLADLVVRADIGDVLDLILRKRVDDGVSLPQGVEKTPLSP